MLAIALAAGLAAVPVADREPVWVSSIAPSGWTQLDSGPESVAFTRTAEGVSTRSRPAVWLRVEYRKAQAPFGYVSSSVLARIDCAAGAYTLSEFSFFPRRNLSGRPSSIPDADKATPIAPDSRLAALYAELCPRQATRTVER